MCQMSVTNNTHNCVHLPITEPIKVLIDNEKSLPFKPFYNKEKSISIWAKNERYMNLISPNLIEMDRIHET